MKILSIDVGIKNLALCIIENNNTGFHVKFWDIINLSEERTYYCNCMTQNKKNAKVCSKLAQYYKDDNFFCKTHANSSNYKLPTSTINKYKSLKLEDLKTLCEEYEIQIDKLNKNEIIKSIENYIENFVLNPITKLKCNTVNLIDIGKAIRDNLNKLDVFILTDLDYILIENQISPIANRMNCIQGMISQYFIMKDMNNILYVSSANKLKPFIKNKKTTYNERKKLGVEITRNFLIKNNIDNINKDKVLNLFNKHKKRDDLADCFLQGIWFLSQYNENIKKLILNIEI